MRQLSDIYNNYSFALSVIDPLSYEETVKCEDWQVVITEEMNSIEHNGMWELVE